ncbi:MAG: ATP-binding protein [Chlorobiaceae bacterium]|jgi:serine/threonine-protein kinase RsbW|nr:ATP-binding protein [Chlorobiaceae bacterium]NTW62739.1 ATP-binding protein [Chlorobiaceae bacterium]
MNTMITMTLPAEIRYVRLASLTAAKVAEIFSASFTAADNADGFCHAFELSVSEAFTNAVRYAVSSDQENMVTINFKGDRNRLTVSVSDSNPPFDPEFPSPDINSYPESGFGLLLIRRLMDTVTYTREDGRNLISMTKQPDNQRFGNL